MGFEASRYYVGREPREAKLVVSGEELLLKVREMPWSRKNQLIAQCLSWGADGVTHFDADLYTRESLKYIIVEAPWGATSDIFLSQLGDGPLSKALESLVPKAFGGISSSTSVDEVKKES